MEEKQFKRHELVVTIKLVLGEAPDARTLRESGLSDLQQYADTLLGDMDLGDLEDFDLEIKASRREVK